MSHFSARMYGILDDLAKTVMNHTNCRFPEYPCRQKITLPLLHRNRYTYTDFIKPNLVGDSYIILLTSLHFPSKTGTIDLTTRCTEPLNNLSLSR